MEEEEVKKFGTGTKEVVKYGDTKSLKKCDYCSIDDHIKDDYRKFKRHQKQGAVQKTRTDKPEMEYWNCGEFGHGKWECEQPNKAGKPGAGGRSSTVQETQSNHLHASPWWTVVHERLWGPNSVSGGIL